MEEVKYFFFDTYAFFEIMEKNPNYLRYCKNVAIVTTKWNLMELHYGLLREYNRDVANYYYDLLVEFAMPVDDLIIKKANEFRLEFKKRELSYVDCLGYTIAKVRGIKFLTGDKQFQDLENVEFVK